MFGASENTIGYATDYMNIYAVGTVFVQLTLGMGTFITAQGFAKVAALATIISQAVSCIWVLACLLGKKTYLKLKSRNMRIM